MSSEVLPYTVKPHPVTGLYSGKLGVWTFLASEIMLFGALFSSYILLRVGASHWPVHRETHLDWKLGMLNTFILIASSVTMVLAWADLKLNNFSAAKAKLWITVLLACAFLFIKLVFEYRVKISHGLVPSTSNFYAIYYVITGLHGLHVVGGIIVIGYLAGPGSKLWNKDKDYYANRIECAGLYWHFVDLVWIFAFPIFYLM